VAGTQPVLLGGQRQRARECVGGGCGRDCCCCADAGGGGFGRPSHPIPSPSDPTAWGRRRERRKKRRVWCDRRRPLAAHTCSRLLIHSFVGNARTRSVHFNQFPQIKELITPRASPRAPNATQAGPADRSLIPSTLWSHSAVRA
jgi:hypothetical protein